MLFNVHALTPYWVDVFNFATYIVNCLLTKVPDKKRPFEVLYNTMPKYDVFRISGCRVFPYLCNYSPHKLGPRSSAGIFIGYDSQYKGYYCLEPSTSFFYTTFHYNTWFRKCFAARVYDPVISCHGVRALRKERFGPFRMWVLGYTRPKCLIMASEAKGILVIRHPSPLRI